MLIKFRISAGQVESHLLKGFIWIIQNNQCGMEKFKKIVDLMVCFN